MQDRGRDEPAGDRGEERPGELLPPPMRNTLREKLQDKSKGDMDKPEKAFQELPFDVQNWL